MELYHERLKSRGRRPANIGFAVDVLLLFRPGIIRSIYHTPTLNPYDMLINYFKVGVRNILRYKVFSFINVFGLAIAMSVCLLVIQLLVDQYQYDSFHGEKDRVYRILSKRPYSDMPMASTPPSLASTLSEGYATVEEATSLIIGVGGDAVANNKSIELRGYFGDENFFNVFGFGLDAGDKSSALSSPQSIIISKKVAVALFRNEEALGKTVQFYDRELHYLKRGKDSPPVDWGTFTITGVFTDDIRKSHLKFDVLMSAATRKLLIADGKIAAGDGWDNAFNYVLVAKGKSEAALNETLNALFERKFKMVEEVKDFRLFAQALMSITPGIMVSQPPSFQLSMTMYYVLGFIALAIMLSASLNYTNLSTARALTRLKEIGIRKVTGAHRRDLVLQFLSESLITTFLSLFFAMLLLLLLRPAFSNLWLNRYLEIELTWHPMVFLYFLAFALIIGIVAGMYPALYLSRYQPIKAIKDNRFSGKGKLGMRKALSVVQFVVSLFFIVTSLLIYAQYKYFQRFDYGFKPDGIVNVSLQGNDFYRIAESLGSVTGVLSISASEYIPGTGRTSGRDIDNPEGGDPVNFRILAANETFIPNLGLKIIAGRNLSPSTDSISRSIVINETGARVLGFKDPADIIGATVMQTWEKEPLEIVGVVSDFWAVLPIGGDPLAPLFIQNTPQRFSYANIKIDPRNRGDVVAQLERLWKKADQLHPFKYDFYEADLHSTHEGIHDVVSIVGLLAFIAVVVACLGMLGMAMYTAERKRKEVGIRKVLGASGTAIVLLLSREFIMVLTIAICIGGPLSYFANKLWLETFRNRAPFTIDIIIDAVFILLILGLGVIASQSVRASSMNPVESLKTDG